MIDIHDTRYPALGIIRPHGSRESAAGYPNRRVIRPMGVLSLAVGIHSVEYSARR